MKKSKLFLVFITFIFFPILTFCEDKGVEFEGMLHSYLTNTDTSVYLSSSYDIKGNMFIEMYVSVVMFYYDFSYIILNDEITTIMGNIEDALNAGYTYIQRATQNKINEYFNKNLVLMSGADNYLTINFFIEKYKGKYRPFIEVKIQETNHSASIYLFEDADIRKFIKVLSSPKTSDSVKREKELNNLFK